MFVNGDSDKRIADYKLGDKRQGEIKRMLPRHFRILELALQGFSNTEIAEELNMAASTVCKIQRSPLFQKEITDARRDRKEPEFFKAEREATVGKARSILEVAAADAAKAHIEVMQNTDDMSLKLRAADKILDRAMGSASEGQGSTVILSADQVQLLTIAMQESSHVKEVERNGPDVQDANPSEDEQGDVRQDPEG
jgi:transcriptional regulator